MKTASYLLLLLFTVVLIVPMALELCDVNVKISTVLSLGEEEKIDKNLSDSEQLNFEEIITPSIEFNKSQRTISFTRNHTLWNSYDLDNSYPPPEPRIL
ncbi:MAG: hypothetical protein AAFP76_07150 [Bacteroidota bacterium]